MSFPLIQQDSPLQKLADVLRTIRTDMEARRANQEQLRRQQEYLQLHQAQFAAQERERGIDNERASRAEQRQTRLDDIAVQQGLEDRKRRGILDENAMTQQRIAGVRAGLPDNVTITDEAAMLSPEHRQVLLQGATADARQGLQGSASRAPVMGSYKGVTVDPGMRNVNLPAGGGRATSRAANDRNMLGIANTDALVRANQLLNQLQEEDPQSPERGWGSAIMRGLGGRLGAAVAGEEGRDALANVGLSDNQTQFDRTLEQWVHNYLPNIPGFRMSVPMFLSVKRAFSVPYGETSDQIKNDVMMRRNRVTEGVVRARAAGLTEEEFAMEVVRLWREGGAGEAADELETVIRGGGVRSGANASGRAVGVPGAGAMNPELDMDDEEPIVLPRYQRRP